MDTFGILNLTAEKEIPFVSPKEVRRIFTELSSLGFFELSRPNDDEEEKFKEFARWFRYESGGCPTNIRDKVEYILSEWFLERFCPCCLDEVSFVCETESRTYHGKIITNHEDFHLDETIILANHFPNNIAEMVVYDQVDKMAFRCGLINGSLANKPNIIFTTRPAIPDDKIDIAECRYIIECLWDVRSWASCGYIAMTEKWILIDRILFQDEPEDSMCLLSCLSYKDGEWQVPSLADSDAPDITS